MSDLITATGKSFKSDYFTALDDPPVLFARVLEQNINTVQTVFSNPNETSCLSCGSRVAFGYTNLQSILREEDAFKVTLTK